MSAANIPKMIEGQAYRVKGGEDLGTFSRASPHMPEGSGRGVMGTVLYFSRGVVDPVRPWLSLKGRTYEGRFDYADPRQPEDIEPVPTGGRRRKTRSRRHRRGTRGKRC